MVAEGESAGGFSDARWLSEWGAVDWTGVGGLIQGGLEGFF
jgi:hypothetical protein